MQTICISLGGSVISNSKGLNIEYIKGFRKIIENYKKIKFVITVGGGFINRNYIESLRKNNIDEFSLDEIGITFTYINALAVKSFFKNINSVYPSIVKSVNVQKAANQSRIIFCSGSIPGITTDADSVLRCESLNAKRLINISLESGIYNKDPKEKGAKKLLQLTHNELIEIAKKYDTREAKVPFVFDIVASKIARRSNIRIDFIGSNLKDLELAILNKQHSGSIVKN
ncbi:MAG: hypothetical protein ACP5RI_00230 [Candidatus Micrarchaeia archaeon]